MLNSLIEELKEVKELRKSKRRTYAICLGFTIIIKSLLRGYVSYNQITSLYKAEAENLF